MTTVVMDKNDALNDEKDKLLSDFQNTYDQDRSHLECHYQNIIEDKNNELMILAVQANDAKSILGNTTRQLEYLKNESM